MLRKKIGYSVKELRKAKGYSQQQLAEKAGVSWQYVGNVERGESAATVDALERLIKALGCTPGQLLAPEEIEAAREVHDLIADVPPRAREHILSAMRHVVLAVKEAARETNSRRK